MKEPKTIHDVFDMFTDENYSFTINKEKVISVKRDEDYLICKTNTNRYYLSLETAIVNDNCKVIEIEADNAVKDNTEVVYVRFYENTPRIVTFLK